MKRLIAVVLPVIVFCVFCQKKEVPSTAVIEEKPAKAVNAIRVVKTAVAGRIMVSGVAAGIQEVTVISETMGKISSVNFSLGAKIDKGADLLSVDATVLKAAFEQARSALVSAELQYNVTKKLYESGNASEAEFRTTEVQKTASAAAVESAKKSLMDTRIIAPISGFIATKDNAITIGNFLGAGTPVTRIIDISTLKATVLVGEHDIVNIKSGLPAEIFVPALKRSFEGKVLAVAPGNDQGSGAFPVEVTWKNTVGLAVKSGMSVHVTVEAGTVDSIILVPISSVVEKEQKKAVLVDGNGQAVVRFVRTGRIYDAAIEILDGVESGDILIVSGMTTLERGDKIAVSFNDISAGGN